MNRIFTLLVLGTLCFTLEEAKAQTIVMDFEAGVPDANCWTNINFGQNKEPGPNGNRSAAPKGVTSASLTTPFIDMPAGGTIAFDYKATDNATNYTLTVRLVSLAGTTTVTTFNVTNTAYQRYTSPALPGGIYRVALEYSSNATNQVGQKYVEVDNLNISGRYHYSDFCNAAPVGVADTYAAVTLVGIAGNVLANDTDPNMTTHGETISVVSNTTPTAGTLAIEADGDFIFTPNASFTGGPVTFTYTIADNGYSPLTATATVTITYPELVPSPLPIKLLSFTGQLVSDKAQLSWSVDDNETGNYFKVERSTDGRNFAEAALIYANGKSGKQSYSYAESLASHLNSYYRLKIVNHDGPPAYSKTVLIRSQPTSSDNTSLSLLTNPISATLRFTYTTTMSEQSRISIYNVNGSSVLVQQVKMVKGLNYVELETGALPKGLYVLEVHSPTTSRRVKFTK